MARFPVTVWVECGETRCGEDCDLLIVDFPVCNCAGCSWTPLVRDDGYPLRCQECLAAEAAHKESGAQ